jgi:hypothetical protein
VNVGSIRSDVPRTEDFVKRVLIPLGVVLVFAGCSKKSATPDGANPIDKVMEARFLAEGITPVEASKPELCRRLAADLLGRFLTSAEQPSMCAGSANDIVTRFQNRPEYLHVGQRAWRDRFNSSDVNVDWRYLKDLYEQVDKMQKGQLKYKDFAILAMSHPGFVMNYIQPEDKVKAVFKAFLGRSPTASESSDIASLYRPWLPSQEPDPDFPYIYRTPALILAALCDPLTTCTANMFGGGQLDLSGFVDPTYQGLKYEDLTAAQIEAIREPGRVLTAQPFFWEAGADAILNRYLAWSDGGRFPREPGIVLPEVREALAEYLKSSDNYPAAERVLLTSWLYRQAAQVADDGQGNDPAAPVPAVYAHGPVKPGDAEVWLDSTAALTLPLGTCDARYSDGFAYFLIMNASMVTPPLITSAQAYADVKKLYTMRGDQEAFDDANNYPDFTYLYVARLIGGCPGFQSQRQGQTGLSFAFTQESISELLCDNNTAQNLKPTVSGPTLDDILVHQMRLTYGRDPSAQDKADFATAKATCTGADCTESGMENAVCVGLLGSAEMVFY